MKFCLLSPLSGQEKVLQSQNSQQEFSEFDSWSESREGGEATIKARCAALLSVSMVEMLHVIGETCYIICGICSDLKYSKLDLSLSQNFKIHKETFIKQLYTVLLPCPLLIT